MWYTQWKYSLTTLFTVVASVLLWLTLSFSSPASAQTLFQATPLVDGDTVGLYKGLHGYLYGHWSDVGTNTPDPRHDTDGKSLANTIALNPICHNGDKNNCKIVAVAIGMSHWTKELCHEQQPGNPQFPFVLNANCDPWTFIYKAAHNLGVNSADLVLVDCAQDGAPAQDWLDDTPRGPYAQKHYTDCNNWMSLPVSQGGSGLNVYPDQVQIILFKQADSGQRETLIQLPAGVGGGGGFIGCTAVPQSGVDPDACVLIYRVGTIARFLKSMEYPNASQMFVQSRSYGGYANVYPPPNGPQILNPEPFAFEEGFAMKWLIQSQIDEVSSSGSTYNVTAGHLDYTKGYSPWIDWGSYIWAANTTIPCQGCSISGLTWVQSNLTGTPCAPMECDFQIDDFTHPSSCGRDKVSNMLMYSYCNSPYSMPWFSRNGLSCMTTRPTDTCAYE